MAESYCQFALRAGDKNAVAHLCADGFSKILAQHQGRIRRVDPAFTGNRLRDLAARFRFKILGRAGDDGAEQAADRPLLVGDDALDEREAGAGTTRDQHLSVDSRRGGGDVRNAAQAVEQRLPVANAVRLDAHQVHVGRDAEQTPLEVLPHAVGDGQGDDERSHTRGHAGDGDDGDHAHNGLPPLGLQIPGCYVQLESH